MAITVLSSPALYSSCYNEQWFPATSSQVAQPNFKYTVVITDIITGASWTEQIEPNPSNQLLFDASTYAEKYMVNYIPTNVYGWQKCTNAVRKIRVNIGETYGSTPAYYVGSNIDYYVWNAAFDLNILKSYTLLNYVYDSTAPAYKFLSQTGSLITYEDRSNFLYVLVKAGLTADVPNIIVKSYNSAGTLIGTSTIARPSFSTGTYTDQYQCIDVGKKGLDNINNLLVTGTFPILGATTSYYTVEEINFGIVNTFTIGCSPKFTCYSLHYLKDKGSYGTLHCNLVSQLDSTKTVTSFKKNPWSLVSSVMTLDANLSIEKTQGVTIQDTLKLNSDWLTDAEFVQHKELFTSIDVRLDLGLLSSMLSVKVTNTGYTTRNNDKLRNLQIDLSYSHSNTRQRG